MAHSVIVTTRIPTLDETVKRDGLSRADREFVKRLFDGKRPGRETDYAFRSQPASSKLPKNGRKKTSAIVRDTKTRARKTA